MGVKLLPISLYLTIMCSLVRLNIKAPQLLTTIERFQTRIREVCAKTDHDVL